MVGQPPRAVEQLQRAAMPPNRLKRQRCISARVVVDERPSSVGLAPTPIGLCTSDLDEGLVKVVQRGHEPCGIAVRCRPGGVSRRHEEIEPAEALRGERWITHVL